MTCIVGVVSKDGSKVIIGADSAGVAGYQIVSRKDEKVFKVGDFIIGCTGSFRMIQLLRYTFKPPVREEGQDVHEFMCTKFVDAVRECFKEGGWLQKDKEVERGGCFLVAYENRLFCIEGDFQVGERYDRFAAIGCGESYAEAAMYTSAAISGINETVQISDMDIAYSGLLAAKHFSTGVCRPFKFIES